MTPDQSKEKAKRQRDNWKRRAHDWRRCAEFYRAYSINKCADTLRHAEIIRDFCITNDTRDAAMYNGSDE